VKQELGEIAWSIVTGLHSEIVSASSFSTLETTEAARIASLSYVISASRHDIDTGFSQISYEAERLGISFDIISDIIQTGLESYKGPLLADIELSDLVTLLGLIHSIGSYHLPLQHDQGTSQRPLGAYYTPQRIAEYIISLTLTPTLDRLAKSVSKTDISPLQKILSLRTLDPACGPGVFLVSAMNTFVKAMENGIRFARKSGVIDETLEEAGILNYLHTIRRNLYGVDVDAGALEVTDVSLSLLSKSTDDSSFGTSLKQGNSLISLKGLNGKQSHGHYFSNTATRLPFEWPDEFVEVLRSGGFDFVVMNPPYERLKPNLAEFLRERILSGDRKIHLEEFKTYKDQLKEDLEYFRQSGEYQLGNKYSIDVYRLFIERAIQLSREGGKIGFIVPSTILGDFSAYPLRKSIILENKLQTVTDFVETSRLFDGVTQSVSVLSLQKGGTTTSFQGQFGLKDIDEVSSRKRVRIQTKRIESVVGPFLSIPQVNTGSWTLLDKMHKHPTIASVDWLSVKRGELDLTLNRSCIISNETSFRLIRGTNISRYSLLPKSTRTPEFVDIEKLRETLGSSSRIDDINKPRIACQQVSNRTQRWRLKFANVPLGVVLANSCNYLLLTKGTSKVRLSFIMSILNSELMNWRFGLTSTNNHVSNRELCRLPLPEIDSISKDLYKSILSEVKSIQNGNGGSLSKIDALVFSIYGFSSNEARIILRMRQTPKNEVQEILNSLEVI
jgi:Alw26I/Eco31I/Esp3I family type II restriction m6 adenine DNA methyltransferase